VINGLSSVLQFLVCEIPVIGTFDAEIGFTFKIDTLPHRKCILKVIERM
jgi:hypothetical protein